MGGKVWSVDEERVFWTEIIPSSKKQHLYSRPNRHQAQGWGALCRVMQERMGQLARRRYTGLMLYEHFFQNCVLERFSPNAGRFVRTYIENERRTTGMTPVERSRSAQNAVRDTGGPSSPSTTGPRPSNLRLSEARTAASLASATQSFGQAPTQNLQNDPQNAPTVGLSQPGPQSSSPVSTVGSTAGTEAITSADTNPSSGQPTPTSSPAAVPHFFSLSNETAYNPSSLQFSLPPLSEILALPLLAAAPNPRLPPNQPTVSTLHTTNVPLPSDYQQRQQYMVPQQKLADRYRSWVSGNANLYPPLQENVANFGTILDSLAVTPVQLPSPASQYHSAATEKPAADTSEQVSAIHEIKEDEEAAELFVQQWPKK